MNFLKEGSQNENKGFQVFWFPTGIMENSGRDGFNFLFGAWRGLRSEDGGLYDDLFSASFPNEKEVGYVAGGDEFFIPQMVARHGPIRIAGPTTR